VRTLTFRKSENTNALISFRSSNRRTILCSVPGD
jgi:hypothetical protein